MVVLPLTTNSTSRLGPSFKTTGCLDTGTFLFPVNLVGEGGGVLSCDTENLFDLFLHFPEFTVPQSMDDTMVSTTVYLSRAERSTSTTFRDVFYLFLLSVAREKGSLFSDAKD